MGCDIHLFVEKKKEGKWELASDAPDYSSRNYDAFALLADVRNYGEIEPICPARGLPKCASQEVVEEAERRAGDGHSHSYLRLAELNAYDWEGSVVKSGYVNPQEYKVFKEDGVPSGWCRGVGGDTKHISNEEMEEVIATGKTDFSYYTQVEWHWKSGIAAGCFYADFLQELRKYAADRGLKSQEIRIVFWFDN